MQSASGIAFQFQREDRNDRQNSHTFYLSYVGPILATGSVKEVKVDVTINEKLVFDIEQLPVLRGYEEYADLPEESRLRVYSLNGIASEKAIALMDRARNEPRDLYDIWHMVENKNVDLGELIGAIEKKLEFRCKKLDAMRGELQAKEVRYAALQE